MGSALGALPLILGVFGCQGEGWLVRILAVVGGGVEDLIMQVSVVLLNC